MEEEILGESEQEIKEHEKRHTVKKIKAFSVQENMEGLNALMDAKLAEKKRTNPLELLGLSMIALEESQRLEKKQGKLASQEQHLNSLKQSHETKKRYFQSLNK